MADVREVFPILQDAGTGAGEGAISRVEGEAAAGQAGLIGFSFKDASGNVVLAQLNSAGALPVAQSIRNCKHAFGTNAGSTSVIDLATLDETEISAEKVYDNLELTFSCYREALCYLVYIDDANGTPVETVVSPTWRVGPGSYTIDLKLECLEISTVGGTGDQNIVLRAQNLNAGGASTMDGFLALNER